jgi:hypothetical protein
VRCAWILLAVCACNEPKARRSEALVQLERIGDAAQLRYVADKLFPVGTARSLPEGPCCAGSGHKCPVTTSWADDRVWLRLGIHVDQPTFYQYGYASDGTQVTATAVGDLDCDDIAVTYRLEMHVRDGEVQSSITAPPAGEY